MRALVTGAGGFSGFHLVRRLEEDGIEVHSVGTRSIGRAHHHLIESVTDLRGLSHVIAVVRPDYVFHLAGLSTTDDSTEYYRVNAGFAATILDALDASSLNSCSVLLAGSSAEYGPVPRDELPITEERCAQPVTHYGISKLSQTQIGLASKRGDRPVVVVRPFNIAGPRMSSHLALQSFAEQIVRIRAGLAPPVVTVGNLNTSRDFIDVRDVAAIYWDAIRSPACSGQVLNVCSGRETRLEEALSLMLEIAGIDADTEFDPTRSRQADAEAHYGSKRKLESLLGARHMRPLADTFKDILSHASSGL